MTRLEGSPPLARCRTWVQGRDLRELGIAAAQELDATEDRCRFTIVEPDNAPGRAFLEVLHRNAEALVGPMAGPTAPSNLSMSPRYLLDDLIELVSLNDATGTPVARGQSYVITVRYASIWSDAIYPPIRADRESDGSYRARCDAAETILIERASRQGFFAVHYHVPLCEWNARDLASLMDLAYQRLPRSEPAAGESGWIAWRPGGPMPHSCIAHVARGDYVASLQLPLFPTLALADWLSGRRCLIDLCHPLSPRFCEASVRSAGMPCRLLTRSRTGETE